MNSLLIDMNCFFGHWTNLRPNFFTSETRVLLFAPCASRRVEIATGGVAPKI